MTDQIFNADDSLNERETDHVNKAFGRLALFETKGRFRGLLQSYVNQIQSIEDLAWAVLIGRLLDNAVGIQLDNIGQIVGETRKGRLDADYRVFLRAKILVNKSNGTVDWALRTIELFSASGIVGLRDLPPAAWIATILEGLTVSVPGVQVATFLEGLSPAGVEFHLGVYNGPLGEWLRAKSFETQVALPARGGFSSTDYFEAPGMRGVDAGWTISALVDYASSGTTQVILGAVFGTSGWYLSILSGVAYLWVGFGSIAKTATATLTPGLCAITASFEGSSNTLRIATASIDGSIDSGTNATGTTYTPVGIPLYVGRNNSSASPFSSGKILGLAYSESVVLNNIPLLVGQGLASLAAGEVYDFGADNLYRALDLETDLVGGENLTKVGVPNYSSALVDVVRDLRGSTGVRSTQVWASLNTPIRTPGVTGPTGLNTAETIEDDSETNGEGIRRTYYDLTGNQQYTFSIYVRKESGPASSTYWQLEEWDYTGSTVNLYEGAFNHDEEDGSWTEAASSDPITVNITDIGSWYLLEFVFTTQLEGTALEVTIFPGATNFLSEYSGTALGEATFDLPQLNPGSSRIENYGGKFVSVYDNHVGQLTSGLAPSGFSLAYSEGFGS